MAHTGCILHNQAKVEEYKAGHSLEVPLTKGDNLGGCNHYLHWSVCRSLTRSEADSRGCEDCIIGGNEHFALQTLLTCCTTVQQRSSEWYQIIASRIWQDVGNQTKENVPARIEVDEDYGSGVILGFFASKFASVCVESFVPTMLDARGGAICVAVYSNIARVESFHLWRKRRSPTVSWSAAEWVTFRDVRQP